MKITILKDGFEQASFDINENEKINIQIEKEIEDDIAEVNELIDFNFLDLRLKLSSGAWRTSYKNLRCK